MGKKVEFKVCGLTEKYFVPLFLVVIICTYGGFMPTVKIGETTGVGMVGTGLLNERRRPVLLVGQQYPHCKQLLRRLCSFLYVRTGIVKLFRTAS